MRDDRLRMEAPGAPATEEQMAQWRQAATAFLLAATEEEEARICGDPFCRRSLPAFEQNFTLRSQVQEKPVYRVLKHMRNFLSILLSQER